MLNTPGHDKSMASKSLCRKYRDILYENCAKESQIPQQHLSKMKEIVHSQKMEEFKNRTIVL